MSTTISNFDALSLRQAISREYTELADNPDKKFHFLSGWPLIQFLGYTESEIADIPESAYESFAGVGNPFKMGWPKPGQTVVDIGCGAGMDILLAAKKVQSDGMAIGIDMTSAMVKKATSNAQKMNAFNTRFYNTDATSMPLSNHFADMVISNGVINLIPEKKEVFNEIFRILKPGGKLQIADVLLSKEVPVKSRDRVHLWTTCVAGGLLVEDYIAIMSNAGFCKIEVLYSYDVFRDAPISSSASHFGAKGYNIYAEKPA